MYPVSFRYNLNITNLYLVYKKLILNHSNSYLLYNKINYSVPYIFGFGQIIQILFTPTYYTPEVDQDVWWRLQGRPHSWRQVGYSTSQDPLVPHHERSAPHNVKIGIETPRFLESAARKELSRILKSGALGEVHHPTPWCSKAIFLRAQMTIHPSGWSQI